MSSWLGEFVLLAALWGASFLFMRLGAAEFGPIVTAGLRVALATVLLWPILLRQGQWPALRQHWQPILLAGVVNSAIPFALYAWAVMHIATGLTSILNATVPLFGALVAWLWLGDRINRLRWLGLALGFVGVALLAWRAPAGVGVKSDQAGWAIAACLAASCCYGIAASYARRKLMGVPPIATATGSQLGAALALALLLVTLPRRACAAVLLLALAWHLALLNQAPTSAYFAQTLQIWEQGRFIRFYGLGQWLGWLWPYAALLYVLVRASRREVKN